MPFVKLPHDIELAIFEQAWADSPASALALAATCRELKAASTQVTRRYLSIVVQTPERLAEDIALLRTTPIGNDFLQHTRHLKLTGRMKFTAAIPQLETLDRESSEQTPCKPEVSIKPVSVFHLEEPLRPKFQNLFSYDVPVQEHEPYAAAWRPLLDLIQDGFAHLKDVIWECKGALPLGFVGALEQYHSNCKLHLREFRFLSLHNETTDIEELRLAQSPLLHSLSVLSVWRDSTGKDDHNEAAALRTLTTAPNLKHFRLLGARPLSSPQLARSRQNSKQQWKGFKPDPVRNEKASLLSFSTLCYRENISLEGLDTWSKHIDFNTIQKACFSVKDAAVLDRLSGQDMLCNLQELSIALKRSKQDAGHYLQSAEAFFDYLPSLRKLEIFGTIHRELLNIIANHHGSTVEELAIKPYEDYYDMVGPPLLLDAEDVELIARNCSNLKEIELTIKRTGGDNRETKCYEALGELSQVRKVVLNLDCCNPAPAWGGGLGDQGPRALEMALINSAIDETLALTLWKIISNSSRHSKLETLTITSYGGSSFGNSSPGDLMDIVRHISRSYTITRQDGGDLDVVELTKVCREESDKRSREHQQQMLEKWGNKGRANGAAYQAMGRLWKLDDGFMNWREAWSSFPLQRSSHEEVK